jgi:acetoin utilization deacetylase AcuC-like enzyme
VPDILIISFGTHTFKDDPIAQFCLEYADLIRIGEQVVALRGQAIYNLGAVP